MTKSQTIPPETDPELAAIWKKHGMPKFFIPRADKMPQTRRLHAQGNIRFMKSAFVKDTLGDQRPWTEEDRPITVRDGHAVAIRIYRPTAHSGERPVMVYTHSGGWCMGGLDTEEFLCQLLCMKLGIVVVSVAYRLAPEWAYPTCIYDTFDVMKWLSVNAKSIGGDLTKGFLTGGASGGGNVVTMAGILARDKGLRPALTGHLILCTGMPFWFEDSAGNGLNLFAEQLARGSWERYKDGPVTTRAMSTLYGQMAKVDAQDPLATPLTQTDFSGLGPVYALAAEMDIWRDSAVFYCDRIREAGGRAKLEIYPGVSHMWWQMYPELSINRKGVKNLVEGVGWLLTLNGNGAVSSRL